MARSYRLVDRDQQFLMPPSLRDWLPADHLVWFVVEVVAQLDTSGFHARHPKAGPGRRAFDPDMLLAVLVYAYAVGERSSRRIEGLCREHVAFQVLCAQDVPDHTVISRFRARHEDQFAGVFAQVLVLCANAGMVKLGTVAIDGTKIAADASIFANRSEESLRAEAARIAAQVMGEAAKVDAEEDALYGDARGDEVAAEFVDPATRAAAIKAALAEIEAQKNRSAEKLEQDNERRAERWAERAEGAGKDLAALEAATAARIAAWIVGHARAEADDTSPRPKGVRPASENDKIRQARRRVVTLQHRADAARPPATPTEKTGLKSGLKANMTDPESRIMNTRTGWVQGYNAQLAVTADHLILALLLIQATNDMGALVPMMDAAQAAVATIEEATKTETETRIEIGLVLADAGYCSDENLTAPGPDRLIATGKDRRLSEEAADDPRTGPPPENGGALEQMRHRMRTPEGLTAYARRGATVEPVNAHLKDQTGLRRFSRRGLSAATSELNLAAAVVNLLKLHRHTTAPAS